MPSASNIGARMDSTIVCSYVAQNVSWQREYIPNLTSVCVVL